MKKIDTKENRYQIGNIIHYEEWINKILTFVSDYVGVLIEDIPDTV